MNSTKNKKTIPSFSAFVSLGIINSSITQTIGRFNTRGQQPFVNEKMDF